MRTRTARPISRLLVGLVLLALGAGACGGGGAEEEGPTAPPATTAPAEGSAEGTPAGGGDEPTEDGTHPSRLVEVRAGTLTVDRIEILSGEAAATARAEDGEAPVEPGADIPYLRNRNPRLRTLPVAVDVRVRVVDCSAGCGLTTWSYADLVAGGRLPYGSPDTPFEVTVRGGQVVEIAEVYLP